METTSKLNFVKERNPEEKIASEDVSIEEVTRNTSNDETKGDSVQATEKVSSESDSDCYSSIIRLKPDIKWSEVAGLRDPQDRLKEAVILPIKFPQLFSGARQPWKGVLLYGVPGSGKTFLVNALATEVNSTNASFFSISSWDLISSYLTDGEQLLKTLFYLAKKEKPSVIFIDEIDVLCGFSNAEPSESQRRMKTNLMYEMGNMGDEVYVIGATNAPWIVDGPLLKRYSCSDICVIVRDAMMEPIRRIQKATHFKQVQGPSPENPDVIVNDLFTPCDPEDDGAQQMSLMDMDSNKLLLPTLSMSEMMTAISSSKSSIDEEYLKLHHKFTDDYVKDL